MSANDPNEIAAELREMAEQYSDPTDELMRDAADTIDALKKQVSEHQEYLKFIERWAVYKTGPADERLSVIAHYPPISAISKSFTPTP